MVLPKADTSSWKLIFLAAWCWQGQIFRYPAWTFSRNTCSFMFDGACGRRRLISNAFLKLPGGRIFFAHLSGERQKKLPRGLSWDYIFQLDWGERLRIRWKKMKEGKKKKKLCSEKMLDFSSDMGWLGNGNMHDDELQSTTWLTFTEVLWKW